MHHIGTANSINPALKVDSAKWTVDILNISNDFQYSGAAYNSLVQSDQDQIVADVNFAIQQLAPTGNNINLSSEVETPIAIKPA